MRKRSKAKRHGPAVVVATPTPATPKLPTDRRVIVAGVVLLFAACLIAYWPCLWGEYLWDDDAHVTRPGLRSLGGLYRIWFELDATQQYYPLLHSVFWFEHRLWGDEVLAYHLVNVLLHATTACLAWAVLRKLKIPGAYLAAAIFALHPVHVESVAWITEQKNTLSAVFYLGAMWCYLRFDDRREWKWYWLAFALFVLGLLCKTVTATLPAALLVIFWWQRGSLSWQRDVVPLLPFFLLGAAGGLITAKIERKLIGAEGKDFEMSAIERGLLAGRVFWFYLFKLFWPTNLTFIYPRWEVNPAIWWQWVFTPAALAWFTVLWFLRVRVRAPLAGMLFFAGTLFPVLGFLNVYPFLYSFVADHFQYLASLGVIVLVAAGIMLAPFGNAPAAHWARYGFCLLLLATLGKLTWKQSHMYSDPIALYQTTIDRNPNCWMAYNNMGTVLDAHGKTAEALVQFETAVRMRPNDHQPNRNVGRALLRLGKTEQSIPYLQRAVELEPNDIESHLQLALAWTALNQWENAANAYIQAILQRPYNPYAIHHNLGGALANLGRLDDAIDHFRHSAELNPNYAEAQLSLGKALKARGDRHEAIPHLKRAAELSANPFEALMYLRGTYEEIGQPAEAIAAAERAQAAAQSKGQLEQVREVETWLNYYRANLPR